MTEVLVAWRTAGPIAQRVVDEHPKRCDAQSTRKMHAQRGNSVTEPSGNYVTADRRLVEVHEAVLEMFIGHGADCDGDCLDPTSTA